MSFTVKRSTLDVKFSDYIRAKAGWRCERCGSYFVERPGKALQCSHYYGRRKEAVRFDPDNADSLCAGCHQFFGEHREDSTDPKTGLRRDGYTSWKLKKIGPTAFDFLTLKANTPGRPDYKMINLWLTRVLQTYGL